MCTVSGTGLGRKEEEGRQGGRARLVAKGGPCSPQEGGVNSCKVTRSHADEPEPSSEGTGQLAF